jgi:aspartate aminotransferase
MSGADQFINERVKQLKPSATLAVKAQATELKKSGRAIIDLSAGEPDIDTPDHIKTACEQALREGKTKYGPVPGQPELRTAIAEKLVRENGLKGDMQSVIVTNGGKQAIAEMFDVTLEPGDEVIIPAPYWVSYVPMVRLSGGVPVVVQTSAESGYKLTPELLESKLTAKTRIVIVNSPSNPTGAGYTKEDQRLLGEVIQRAVEKGLAPQVLVLSDEVYEKLCFEGFTFYSFAEVSPQLAERTVTVGAFSKTYSMTGWRVGYAHGHPTIIAAMNRLQSQTTSNVCTFAQYGALAALQGSHAFLEEMKRNFIRRRDLALNKIRSTKGLDVPVDPVGAFYIFVRIDQLIKSGKVSGSLPYAQYLLESAGVAVVPGEPFGDDGGFRMSTSSSDENITKGLGLLCEATEAL